jgi:arylsulfatase
VVFVTIDTLRADHLGSYGYPRATAPFIDGVLAGKGTVFENARSASSLTLPSHLSFFTSLYPVQHGALTNVGAPAERHRTVAEMFRSAGYETAAFYSVYFLRAALKGFDVHPGEDIGEGPGQPLWRRARGTTDRAIRWLAKRDGRKPLFLWVHYFDVHRPHRAPPEWLKRMKFADAAEREGFLRFVTEKHGVPRSYYGDDRKLVTEFRHYDAEVRYIDDQVRRLYRFMDEKGLNRDALWIVTSDHGEGLGNHFFDRHARYVYMEQVRIPLIFHLTGRRVRAKRAAALARSVDLAPTLAETLGRPFEQPAGAEGRSLVPFLAGARGGGPVYAYAESEPKYPQHHASKADWEDGQIRSLEDGTFKYLWHTGGKDEFFDLKNDPLELKDLADAGLAEHRRLEKELKSRWKRWRAAGGGEERSEGSEDQLKALRSLGYL